ncbi:MAG: hypothetical protein A2X36_07215 [Elusimicrobia bacterium GWA2_69_24]|nr:MAG: hypothetical protein A2X36_07215 [Elusimicrobia bacterium GWA2_69_24]HBL15189.1 hypothetical protein [Elusimicrobiota bacterium]
MNILAKLLRDRKGQGTVEYLMMIAVIVGVIMVIGTMFKPQMSGIFNSVMEKIRGTVDFVGAPR